MGTHTENIRTYTSRLVNGILVCYNVCRRIEMPTKGFYIRVDNYTHLEESSKDAGCSASEYLNQLIEDDRGDRDQMKVNKAVMKDNIKRGLPTSNGDGLNTCKSCGSVLPYYKGKCKNC